MTIHDISLRQLRGSKGQSSPKNTKDNLFSTDLVEVLLGISEGPIKGLKDGAKSYYIGQTTLKDVNGENNFDSFELINYKGSDQGENIFSRTGGFGASTSVGTQLATNVAVIRTGTHTQIDYIDVRFAINQLVKSTKKGTFNHTGRWTVEYKPVSASVWTPVRTNEANPLPPQISGENFDIFYGDKGTDSNINGAPGDRPTFWTSTQPISTANAGIWFNTSNNYQPKVFDGETWKLPTNLAFANNHWTWTEASSWGSDKATRAFVGSRLPAGQVYEQGDYWLHTGDSKAYFFNGSSWVDAGSTLRPGTFGENGTGGSVVVTNGEIALTGKATQVFPKEFRIPVEPIDEPYMIRVVKTSPNNTTELFFDITWESFQEVSAKAYNFPGTATTQLVARASEQFSSIPDFGGIYEGRIVRVPSNYNTVTRTYAGVWDGTWKLAYSNNPAFVGNDLVLHDRYGMNAYYPVTLNKWDIYEAGVWCDTRVASGQPRFTFNGLISDPRGGRDALNYIFGIFAGRFFDDGNGTGVIKIDKDEGAAVIFTPENVVDGVFTYSFTEISTRHNEITVAFTNPDLQWQEDRRLVRDEDHIAQYGRIPHNFIAVGCTNAEEAIRRAKYHLVTGIKETMMVNFKTNRMGLYMSPYDVVLVSDPDMEFGLSGRVQSVTGARTIKLREPIYLEPGFSHKISFQAISSATGDFVIESRNLTSASGALTQLTVTADLPALPADCVFTIEQTNGDSAPIAFRVMSISEIDGDPDHVEIQAMQMYRAKWLFIDGIIGTIGDVDKKLLETKKKPSPPRNLKISATRRRVGSRYATTVVLDWDKSVTKTVSRYKIEGSRNNGPMSTLADTSLDQFEWDDVPTGEYIFQVSAVDINGYESRPQVIEHRLIGDVGVVDEVSSLRMVDEPSETEFESRSPVFQWSEPSNPNHEEYVVRITTTDDILIREELITANTYCYEYAVNQSDGAGVPRRAFKIGVSSSDSFGFRSPFVWLSVSNPAPVAPTNLSVDLNFGAVILKYDVPPIRDFKGVMVYSSTEEGFTPSPANLAYKGPNNNVALVREPGATHYFKLALYDVFDDDSLNFSNQLSIYVSPATTDSDVTPPAPPTNLVLTPGVGFLLAEWTNPTDADLDVIELFYNTVNNSATSRFGASSRGNSGIIPGMPHGVPIYAWARSVDRSGNRSALVGAAAGPATPTLVIADVIDDAVIEARHLQDQIIDTQHVIANAIGRNQIAPQSISSAELDELAVLEENIASGAVSGEKIQANAVTAVKILAGTITGEKIAADTITGEKIAAKTISAKQLLLTDTTAINADPLFEDAEYWTLAGKTAVKAVANGPNGPKVLYASTDIGTALFNGQVYPIQQDRTYLFEVVARSIATPNKFFTVIKFFDANGVAVATSTGWPASNLPAAYHYFPSITADLPTTWTRSTLSVGPNGQAAIPAGAVSFVVGFRFNYTATTPSEQQVNMFRVTEMARGELIVDGAVTAQHIAANTITAREIAARSISTNHLVISDFENMIPNGNFEQGSDITGELWMPSGGTWGTGATPRFYVTPGSTPTGSMVCVIDCGVSGGNPAGPSMNMGTKDYMPVTSGEWLAWEICYRSGELASSVGFWYRIVWYDRYKTPLASAYSDVIANGPLTTAWTVGNGQVQVPATAAFCRVFIYMTLQATTRYVFLDRVGLRKAKGAELIVDGTIIADKLAANSVTAAKIAADSVTADKINVSTLSAITANVGRVTAGKIADAATDATSKFIIDVANGSLEWFD